MDDIASTYVYGEVEYFNDVTKVTRPATNYSLISKLSRIMNEIMPTVGESESHVGELESHVRELESQSNWTNYRILTVIILSLFILYGSGANLLFVLSFHITSRLKKIGNAYILAQGWCDLAITAVVLPLLTIYLHGDGATSVNYCKLLHVITQMLVYSQSIVSVLTAIGWVVFPKPTKFFSIYIALPKKVVISGIFLASAIVAVVGRYTEMEFDFCARDHFGNIYFRAITNFFMFVLPSLTSFSIALNTFIRVGVTRAEFRTQFRGRCFMLIELNLVNHFLFIMFWTPYLVMIYLDPSMDDVTYTYLVIFGLIRSSLSATLYGMFNLYFRRAFWCTYRRILTFDYRCLERGEQPDVRRSEPDVRLIPFWELQEEFRSEATVPRRLDPSFLESVL